MPIPGDPPATSGRHAARGRHARRLVGPHLGVCPARRRSSCCATGCGSPSRLIGPLILMLTFGYGISFDVEKLPFAVLDRDQSIESRSLSREPSPARAISASRPPLRSEAGDRPAHARGRAAPRHHHSAGLRPRPAQQPPARGRLLARRRQRLPRRDHPRLHQWRGAGLCRGSGAAHLWRGAGPHADRARAALSLQSGLPQRRSPSRPASS